MYDSTSQAGWLPRQWHKLVGKADPVALQLRELSRQGLWFSRWAHFCAFLMLVLFSLGSLVGVAGASTAAFLAAWHGGRFDLIQAISSSVSAVLVLCMDTAALYAAMQLRMIEARGEGRRWTHWVIIIVADILEAGAYLYMSWLYDVPALPIVWALIIGRAIAAPFFALYLSLARPFSVGARDMLHMVEMAAGKGLITDVTVEASDPAAPTSRKAEIFNAAALMPVNDRSRLAGVVAVLTGSKSATTPTPPNNGGTPLATRPAPMEGGNLDPASVVAAHWLENSGEVPSRSRRPRAQAQAKAKGARNNSRKRARDPRSDSEKFEAVKDVVLAAMAQGRRASVTEIVRKAGVASSTASNHRSTIEAEEAAAKVLPIAR